MANSTINDFLRFSAYSIKELITRKLSEDSKFTDQIYEGSNLAILIDIVSYMYQCLIYNINNAASESMFSDTQMYENISRLCHFIGYHPLGFKPAQMQVYIDNATIKDVKFGIPPKIYPCSALDTGLYDRYGHKIYFSTIFDNTNNFDPIVTTSDSTTSVMLMNGLWKLYGTTLVANGSDYETFVLDGIASDSKAENFVANNKIQVFVEYANADDESKVERWDQDPNEIFIQAYDSNKFNSKADEVPIFSKLYNEQSKVYTVYLNENKTYELKFGNGILGKKLSPGDKIHVLYLDSNGFDGYIDMSQVDISSDGRTFEHSPQLFGMSNDLYKKIFNIDAINSSDNIANCGPYTISFNPNSLTQPMFEEGVEDIRQNAPEWFKTGNRLITKKDYEYFITSNRNDLFSGVLDVKCMNNWDYMTTFYRWLYNMALNPIEYANSRTLDPYRYLSKSRLVQAGYEYVDAADANNIYLWIATTNDSDILALKSQLNNQIVQIKTMTSETYPLSPVNVYFDLSFTPTELYYNELVQHNGDNEFDRTLSYLEVTVTDNIIYSTTQLVSNIAQIIRDAFDSKKCKLGQTVNYDSILNQIYSINGVERIRTIFYPEDYLDERQAERYTKYKTRACDGIAFASWSNTPLIDVGDDLQINNTSRTLEDFQFPMLVPGSDVASKIKVIKKSMNTTSPIKF